MAWYETFFDQHYLETTGLTIPPERTQQETDFIRETLELPEGARILDLGCGHGRHAIELAADDDFGGKMPVEKTGKGKQ